LQWCHGNHRCYWENRLSKLTDYRKIHGTAMFTPLQRKHKLGSGSQTKVATRLHTGRSQVCLPRVPEAWGLGEASIVRRRGHQKLAWTMMQRVFAEGRGCTRECTNWQHRLKMCAKHHRQPCRRRFQTRRIFEWNGEVHSPHPEIEPKKFRYFSQEIHKN
jgi:hypothetical protein